MSLHRGKLAKHPRILSVRPLTREDLGKLREVGRVQPRVRGFRDTHHRLARLCALGMRDADILRMTGYSYNRLNTLRTDPTFQELIAQYRGSANEAYADAKAEIDATAAELVIRNLRMREEHYNRADEAGELLNHALLIKDGADLMDRFGPSKKTVNTNVNLTFARVMEQRMRSRGQATVIDAEVSASAPALIPREATPITPEGIKFLRR